MENTPVEPIMSGEERVQYLLKKWWQIAEKTPKPLSSYKIDMLEPFEHWRKKDESPIEPEIK